MNQRLTITATSKPEMVTILLNKKPVNNLDTVDYSYPLSCDIHFIPLFVKSVHIKLKKKRKYQTRIHLIKKRILSFQTNVSSPINSITIHFSYVCPKQEELWTYNCNNLYEQSYALRNCSRHILTLDRHLQLSTEFTQLYKNIRYVKEVVKKCLGCNNNVAIQCGSEYIPCPEFMLEHLFEEAILEIIPDKDMEVMRSVFPRHTWRCFFDFISNDNKTKFDYQTLSNVCKIAKVYRCPEVLHIVEFIITKSIMLNNMIDIANIYGKYSEAILERCATIICKDPEKVYAIPRIQQINPQVLHMISKTVSWEQLEQTKQTELMAKISLIIRNTLTF